MRRHSSLVSWTSNHPIPLVTFFALRWQRMKEILAKVFHWNSARKFRSANPSSCFENASSFIVVHTAWGNYRDNPCRGEKIYHSETHDPRFRCIELFRSRQDHRRDIHQFTTNAKTTEHAITVRKTTCRLAVGALHAVATGRQRRTERPEIASNAARLITR